MRASSRYAWLLFVVFFSFLVQADEPSLQQQPEATRAHDLAAREAQYRSLLGLIEADVKYGEFGRLRQLEGRTGLFATAAAKLRPGESADVLLQHVKRMLMANGMESLVVREAGPMPRGTPYGSGRFYFTDQRIDGIPVLDAPVNFVLDPSGQITKVNSQFVPQGAARRSAEISLHAARTKLEQALTDSAWADKGSASIDEGGSLAFWTDGGTLETPVLLWMIVADFTKDRQKQLVRFGVDAATGEVRYSQPMSFGIQRSVYTNNYVSPIVQPPAERLLWTEGSPGTDQHALSIYDRALHPVNAWAGAYYAYDVLGLVAHVGPPGGDGAWAIIGNDNKPYLFFTDHRAFDDDAIAHEYGHAIFWRSVLNRPQSTRWYDEFWAGNEFWGDYSAVVTDIHRFGVNANTWEITDLRSWSDPQSRGNYNDWYPHRYFANPLSPAYSNSTIFGYAVQLMVNGGMHRRAGAAALQGPIPSIQVPPSPTSAVREILQTGLFVLGLNNLQFNGPSYASKTREVAASIYGVGSGIYNSVDSAWKAVGIAKDCSGPPPVPSPTIQPQYCRGIHDIFWNAIPNAKYHGQAVTAIYGWDSPQTVDVVDGTNTSCHQSVLTYTRFRLRACNACGCSNWSPDEFMSYYSPCY